MRSAFSLLLLSTLFAFGCAHDKYRVDSNYHIGQINAPCLGAEPGKCKINDDLRAIEHCTKIDKDCPGANWLLDDLFGPTRHSKFANYIVYLDQREGRGTLAKTQPVLMWNRQNTRFLFGAQEVYVLVFTEYKVCVGAQITTIAKTETNPFDAVLKALGKSLGPADTPAALKTQPAKFVWYPLSGDAEKPGMWLAIGSLPVEMNTTDWITVQLMQPTVQPKSPPETNTPTVEIKVTTDRITGQLMQPTVQLKPPPETTASAASLETQLADQRYPSDPCLVDRVVPYKAPFLARNAFFSDNRESRVGVAVAFGLTFIGQKVGPQGASNPNLNGYAMAKLYPIPRFRPKLVTDPNSTGGSITYVRPSIGIVVGTNIGSPGFSELVVGVSAGHLVGNAGLIIGINEFAPAKPDKPEISPPMNRRGRPFIGVEYSF
jgi:hypothetical protein